MLALAAALAPGADGHFKFGQYTYKERSGSGCRTHVDPINVVFYGSRAHRVGTRHNIIRHMNWRNSSGSGQYFASHGTCYGMDFQRGSDGGTSTRFHVRIKQAPHKDRERRWESVGDAHHEDAVFPCGHAVDANGSQGSGFDKGRRQITRRFKRKGHHTEYHYWGNTERFKQCDDDVASSNGKVGWIQVTHVKHR
jgi:hypothetical protein